MYVSIAINQITFINTDVYVYGVFALGNR